MDICCPMNMLASEDSSSFCEFSLDPPEIAGSDSGDRYINDLGGRVTELLNIQSEQKSTCVIIPSVDNDNVGNALKEDDCKDSCEIEVVKFTSNKCLDKCATFPCAGKCKSTLSANIFDGEAGSKNDLTAENVEQSDYAQSSNSPYSHSISLPTPLKLISAMKGSREKFGAPSTKLSVKWAPDVYDPLPSAVSHVPNNRPQRHKSDKKNGRNKQKGGGKASRGNKGKDKKQSRKYGGSSNRSLKSLDYEEQITCSSEPQANNVDFDVSSTDPFCGHSFLKKSVTQLHFPVAEAT